MLNIFYFGMNIIYFGFILGGVEFSVLLEVLVVIDILLLFCLGGVLFLNRGLWFDLWLRGGVRGEVEWLLIFEIVVLSILCRSCWFWKIKRWYVLWKLN